jgi:hypothetical protein
VVLPHGERLMVAAVLDGHGGWQAAEYAQTHLPAAIVKELAHNSNNEDPQQLAAAMGRAFERVDRDFIARIKPAFEVRRRRGLWQRGVGRSGVESGDVAPDRSGSWMNCLAHAACDAPSSVPRTPHVRAAPSSLPLRA